MKTDAQYIHVEVYQLDNAMQYAATILYAFNQLEQRKLLWKEIEKLSNVDNVPWIIMGDFKNVLTCRDHIGG